jgi:hypothetical protein
MKDEDGNILQNIKKGFMIEKNQGGEYYHKYMKYKLKYMNLKKTFRKSF